jgi:hypothetical protein
MVNLLAAARIASRWLEMDVDTATARLRELVAVEAVHVSRDDGWGVLIGKDLRPLLVEPGRPFESFVADFAAGWRTDFLGRRAA